jgi:predicted nucleic acid-binding protein
MILVDTSVWVDHLRKRDQAMQRFLDDGEVLSHPLVVGELAVTSSHEEVLRFVSEHKLFAQGIGYIDAHLLAAVQLTLGTTLWTRDKRLLQVANSFKLAFHPIQ